MLPDKATRQFARKLLEISLENGRLSEEKVQAVLASLRKKPVAERKPLLKAYLFQVRREIAKTQAVVEYAGTLPSAAIIAIVAYGTKLAGGPVTLLSKANPDLIGGLRIRLGDDVIDASVAGRLEQLAQALS